MKFTIKTKELLSALTKLAPLFKGGRLPCLDAVLIVAEEYLRLSATDLNTQGGYRMPAEISRTGKTAVNGNRLLDALTASLEEMCSLETKEEKLYYRCGGVNLWLKSFNPDELPKLVDEPVSESISLDGDVLSESICACLGKVSKDSTRWILNGILFEGREDGLRLVATDGHVLIARHIEMACPQFAAIIPTAALRLLKKMEGVVLAKFDESKFCFTSETEDFIGSLINGNPPNWRQPIPAKKELACSITLDAMALIDALPFAASGNGMAHDRRVRCDISKAEIILSSKSDELESRISVPAKSAGIVKSVAFDITYAREILSSFSGDVTLRFRDEFGPALIEDKNTQAILQFARVS